MLQGIIIAFLFILIFIAIIVMLAFTFVMRWVRKIKNMFHSSEEEDTSNRFHADYTGRRQQSYGYSNAKWTRANSNNKRGTRGRIIDQRDPETANRKIIDDNVGEYVDFEETK